MLAAVELPYGRGDPLLPYGPKWPPLENTETFCGFPLQPLEFPGLNTQKYFPEVFHQFLKVL